MSREWKEFLETGSKALVVQISELLSHTLDCETALIGLIYNHFVFDVAAAR